MMNLRSPWHTDPIRPRTLFFVSPGERCWLCENRPLLHSVGVCLEVNSLQVIFAVCSLKCAEEVRGEIPQGTSVRVMETEQVWALRRNAERAGSVVYGKRVGNWMFLGTKGKNSQL